MFVILGVSSVVVSAGKPDSSVNGSLMPSQPQRKHEIAWAIVRLALALIQIIGATASVLLLISTGASRLTLFMVIVTGLFTLGSRILFSPRKR